MEKLILSLQSLNDVSGWGKEHFGTYSHLGGGQQGMVNTVLGKADNSFALTLGSDPSNHRATAEHPLWLTEIITFNYFNCEFLLLSLQNKDSDTYSSGWL